MKPAWRRAVALALTLMLLAVSASPAAAYSHTATEWGDNPSYGYDYRIPVCLHDNMDGPTGNWNQNSAPIHMALNYALTQFNNLGRELYFYRSNTDCDWYAAHNYRFLQVGWTAINDPDAIAWFTWVRTDGGVCITNCGRFGAIWFESGNDWWFTASSYPSEEPPYDFWTVALHEFGHAGGLAHNWAWDPCAALMVGDVDNRCWYPFNHTHRWLHSDDINGFKAKWAANT